MDTNFVAVQIELTNACSCACAECPRENHMTRSVGMMDLDLAKMIVDDALAMKPDCGFNLNGLGEPLLYKRMPELLRHMESRGAKHVDFFTSLKAPEKLVDALYETMKDLKMNVMLAITKHIYNVNGGENLDLQAFQRNFELMMKLPPAHPDTRIGVERNIGIVANKYHSRVELDEFKEFYGKWLPPESIHVIEQLNPWLGYMGDAAHPDFGPSPPSLGKNVCDYPFILLHTGWDGECLVCCHDDVVGELSLGKIEKPGDLRRIWEGPEYQALRAKHNAYDIDMAPCNHCERTAWARI